jgi:hypothetical protein
MFSYRRENIYLDFFCFDANILTWRCSSIKKISMNIVFQFKNKLIY